MGLTIAASLVLVVGSGQGARGLLLGNYGASTVVLLGLWWTMRQRAPAPPPAAAPSRYRVLLRLRAADRAGRGLGLRAQHHRPLLHLPRPQSSPRLAGLYSIAVKLAGAVAFIVRAFQYAWPPLAYSVSDDAEAARLYGLVTTYYVLVSGWVVAGLALLGRWVLRLLTAPAYFGAYRALPWVALGWALYGLWVVFLVIAGRAKVTTRNFPAALAGLVANVVLLLVLVPPLGHRRRRDRAVRRVRRDARGHAPADPPRLCRSFEWRRLAQLVRRDGRDGGAGDLLLPTPGWVGFLARCAVLAAIPVVLLGTGFAHSAGARAGAGAA